MSSEKGTSRLRVAEYGLLLPMSLSAAVLVLGLSGCTPTPPPPASPTSATSDFLTLADNDANDNAVILFDGRRDTACVNDEIQRGIDVVDMGSVKSDGICNAEITVFSDDDATVFVDEVSPAWTDALGDSVTISLSEGLYEVPLTIWIVALDTATQMDYSTRAAADIAKARELYNSLNTGIAFDYDPATDLINITNPVDVATVVDTANTVASTGFCNVGPISGDSSIHETGRINVYYANFSAFNGFECDDGFVIVMGTTAINETLSHEIGHALDMRHFDTLINNLMYSTGILGRTNFTVGQAFRMNLNPASALNVLGPRDEHERDCDHIAITETCPDIALDVASK